MTNLLTLVIGMFMGVVDTAEAEDVPLPEPVPKVVQIEIRRTVPEILEDISVCESGGRHYKDNGDVVIGRLNAEGLGVDIGKYQINSVFHTETAEKMGLDLYDEHDNEKYALYLYDNQGTQPWNASEDCWGK